jgi:hypothetical protein
MSCRDHAGGVGGIGNIDLTGAKSALPRRSETTSVRQKTWGRFDPAMVNFPEMEALEL